MEDDTWGAFASTIGTIVSVLDKTVDALVKLTESYDAELAEVRDSIIELDHKIGRLAYQDEVRAESAELRRLRGEM